MYDVIRNRGVYLACQFNKFGLEVIFPGLGGQVERVDRNTVSAKAGPWIKGHIAEGFGACRINDLPDIDSHPVTEYFQLIDQGDIDASEDVFKQFRQFRRLGR